MARRTITNNVPRDIIDACELSEKERAEFDYLNWNAIEEGSDSASFFRYKGQLHDLGNFLRCEGNDATEWDGYFADSFFSATVVRYTRPGYESVIVGVILS